MVLVYFKFTNIYPKNHRVMWLKHAKALYIYGVPVVHTYFLLTGMILKSAGIL
jgi:hypothetical protein